MKKRILRPVWSCLLCAVLLAGMVFGIVASSLADAGAIPEFRGGALSRVENLDLDAIRQMYFSDGVKQNERYSYEGERSVIVDFGGESLYDAYLSSTGYEDFASYCESDEAAALRERAEARHAAFRDRLNAAGIEYTYKYSYTTLNDAVALRLSAEDCRTVADMDGVEDVYFSERYAVPKVATINNANVYPTGIYDATGIDYKGEGMVVAILDTGLDYTHEAFATMPTSPAWDKAEVARRIGAAASRFYAKASIDDVFYNSKVPFAYDYADDDADVFPQYSSHGTHVAGIVAGKSNYVVDDKGTTFLGVAPEAQLVIGKVFTDNLDSDGLGGADTLDILAAISDCTALGVDIINMSLGSSAGFSEEKDDAYLTAIYEKVKATGISLVVAASNDYSSGFGGGHGTNLASNPDSGTVGSPSTYDAALSVASINGQKANYIVANGDEDQVAFITEASDENGNSYDFVDLLYKRAGKEKGETLNYKYVVVGGVGRPGNYTPQIKRELANKSGYDGVIALVRRGDITFAEKVTNAMANGADACIIYNNLSGTIRMSLGEVDDPIPTCSVQMDAGKVLVENAKRNVGTLKISDDLKAGPFMSDFSSWGPTPDLRLRPEITAHGGEITSAVAGGYDIYSGTSMAAPNMAGAIALLREHLKKTTSLTGTALAARVNQVLMSTATIALNEEGNPYSPRKQGAGLAGILDAIHSESYLTVPDGKGGVLDKTKIELFDDKEKTGVYEFTFTVNNITEAAATYTPTTYVMTETLATDGKTVAEKAHLLTDSTVTYRVGDTPLDGTLTVPAGESVSVTVTITLGSEGRRYLDESFENGMYVEGFVSLAATGETKVTVGLPYLAFYGDWNDAPLFDYSEYELAESQKDTGVPAEDKLVASAADTKVIGMYYDDKYILSMGAYLYSMDESEVQIYPDPDKIALSRFDTTGRRTIYELYMVYAGLLRGAKHMDIEIRDAATGNVVFSQRQENVSKSYAAGGSNRAAPVMLEIKPDEWGLVNNDTYLVTLKGQLDYPGGEEPKRNSFDFKFMVDYEEPRVSDYRIRYESYTENKKVKYRIYMDVDVSDNGYVQDVMPCYIREDKGSNVLTLATEKPIPVYGEKGKTSTVTFEITDIYDEYVKTGKLYLAVEDYAMNQSTYRVDALTGLGDAGTISLTEDGTLYRTETVKKNTDSAETPYYVYEMSLAPNCLYKPVISAPAESSVWHSLTWTAKRGGEYVRTKNEEIFALPEGVGEKVILELSYGSDEDRIVCAELELTIEGEAGQTPLPDKITIAPTTNGSYYIVNPDTASSIEMHPNMEISLGVSVSPWYVDELDLVWSSSNSDVASVDAVGTVRTHKKGTAYIEVAAKGYDRLRKTVKITVDGDYRVLNYTLYDYYGGENCEIPKDLNVMYIDEECFWYNTRLKRVVLPSTLTELPKNAFKGCENLEEVVIPSQCIVIGESAFAGCKKLEKITFGKFADRDGNILEDFYGTITIGRNAFKGCTSLATIENQQRMTSIGASAFEGCTSLTTLDLSELRVAGAGAFAKCTGLTSLTLGENTAIGTEMFKDCTSLASVTFPGSYLTAGAFGGCKNLTEITFTSENFLGIGESALASTKLAVVTLPNGTYSVGAGAFGGTPLRVLILSGGTHLTYDGASAFVGCDKFGGYAVATGEENPYHAVEDGILYNKDKTELISFPVAKPSIPAFPSTLRRIGTGAFAGVGDALKTRSELDLSAFESIGAYAFAGSSLRGVLLPAGMTELAEGTFSNCSSLTSVRGTETLTSVGARAFFSCSNLGEIDLTSALTVGDSAFRGAKLVALSAPVLGKVGEYAFYSTEIVTLNLPSLTDIGRYAFARMSKLASATLGAVVSMGDSAFVGSENLAAVTFAAGTTHIGNSAFFSLTKLASVTLPDGVTSIGEYAFTGCPIATVNLSGTEKVGAYAFALTTALRTAELSTLTDVGERAFYASALTTANLASAISVGDSAFADTPLTEVTFGALVRLGEYAFARTKLTSVTLPATFNSYLVDYTWTIFDDKGRKKETKTRKVEAYGAGAFSAIPTLTEIRVSATDGFVSLDGVLYAKGTDGRILCQYPAGRVGETYTIPGGTVAIAAHAFEDTRNLRSVEFPYTVRQIGAYAFYSASVTHYTFNSVEAPTLLAAYIDPSTVKNDTLLYTIFGDANAQGNTLASTVYYANFYDFVAKRVYKDIFNPSFYESKDFGLHLTIPKNGTGYDTEIWTNFFGDIGTTENILPDNKTHEAFDAIDEMKNTPKETLETAGTLAELEEIAKKISAARDAYNKVTLKDQLALCEERYATLLSYESALRDAKARLGAPVGVKKLELSSVPNKIRYRAGESFDPTGMVIRVIYEDNSEVILDENSYTLDHTVLSAEDESVTVTYVDGEKTYTLTVLVNVEKDDTKTPTTLPAPTVTIAEDGTATWAPVTGATGYRYRIDDGEEVTTSETSVKLSDGQKITVTAVGDGTETADSAPSAEVTYRQPAPTPEKEEEGFPTWAIVLISVGGVVLLGGLGTLAWFFLRKKRTGR